MSCNITLPVCAQDNGIGLINLMVTTLLQSIVQADCDLSSRDFWPKDYGQSFFSGGSQTYDFIVVGGGTAGSVVASRLSENPKIKVLLLEGGGDPPVESTTPAILQRIHHTKYSYNYTSTYTDTCCRGFKNDVCYEPRGKMIGGSGGINAMLYVRGMQEDYNNWEDLGNPTWGWKDVYPIFEKSILNNLSGPVGGLCVNSFQTRFPELENILFAGAKTIGLKRLPNVLRGVRTGYTVLPGFYQEGERVSPGRGYLTAAKDRPNFHIIKNAQVTKVVIDPKTSTATGVEFIYKGTQKGSVSASKEVILSAGAVDSPKILMLSGIGRKDHLTQMGIPIIKDLKVGDNLQDHPLVPILCKLPPGIVAPFKTTDTLDTIYNYLIQRTGPLAALSSTDVTFYLNSKNKNERIPDSFFHHIFTQAGSSDINFITDSFNMKDEIANPLFNISQTHHLLLLFGGAMKSKTRGTIRLSSSDPADPPLITYNYAGGKEDKVIHIGLIQQQLEYVASPPLASQGVEFIKLNLTECNKLKFKSNNYWKCYMKYMGTTLYHLSGSVKMGPSSDAAAVVNPELSVRGIKNLRVIDASIMPQITSTNTNAPTVMIAEKGAAFIKKQWKI